MSSWSYYNKRVDFDVLSGKTIEGLSGLTKDSEEVTIKQQTAMCIHCFTYKIVVKGLVCMIMSLIAQTTMGLLYCQQKKQSLQISLLLISTQTPIRGHSIS